jgi:teichoic acid transport system permease protein
MLKSVLENRKLVWYLAKDDLKKRFAGSNLGIIWAFIQPIITVLLYWFVFEKGLHASASNLRTGVTVPFVLHLMAGLVPWFYFQEAWTQGTNVFLEYSYLVKKVVFRIEMLPFVKTISALFTHLFFVVFMVVLFWIMGYTPDLYLLQMVYYSFAMFCLVLGLTYLTSAATVFFRDVSQFVNILLQVGTWAPPIMWTIEGLGNMPRWLVILLEMNPMYYIVYGYRDSLINKIGFWEHPYLTCWFWGLTIVLYLVGTGLFKKLRVHFADVL